MEGEKGSSSVSSAAATDDTPPFTAVTDMGADHIPPCFVLPPSDRPKPVPVLHQPPSMLPTINIFHFNDPSLRSSVIEEIHAACQDVGIFQVINHGIPPSLMEGAVATASDFFDLPSEEKMLLMSSNVHKPVRYGTSLNQAKDQVNYWRDFVKHYAHPLAEWVHLWPSNPANYRKKMGNYAEALQMLHNQLVQILFESLGLNPAYLQEEMDAGSQVVAVNCYPVCPEPELTLGLPPHTDYGLITILLQSCPGLEMMDRSGNWHPVQPAEGALIVQLGDQMQVLSNGRYRSVVHRATVNSDCKRFSIASVHSMGLEKKVGPAQELVDEEHPVAYKEYSFQDFLDYITAHDITKKSFINSLKMS